jgi:hypothetical protein
VIGTLPSENPILIPPDNLLAHQNVVREVPVKRPSQRVVIDSMIGSSLPYIGPIDVDPHNLPGGIRRQESGVVPPKV